MKTWKEISAGLALAACVAPCAWAQPAIPPINGAVPVVPTPTTAAPSNLWSFLGKTPQQKANCKSAFCNSPLGQLLNNSMKPVGALSGGLLGPCCPPVDQSALLDPNKKGTAEGVAAAIQADEADAKARRAAVRYLGTVDCHYWPEAQDALVNALRADKNECVRWEAAMALGSGCCCTKKTVKALTIAAEGTDKDGHPAETSERVKCAALMALNHCLSCMPPEMEKKEGPERPKEEGKKEEGAKTANAFDKYLETVTMAQVVAEARQVAGKQRSATRDPVARSGSRGGLFDIAAKAFDGTEVRSEEGTPAIANSVAPPMNVQQAHFQEAKPRAQVSPPATMTADEAPRMTLMRRLRELRQGDEVVTETVAPPIQPVPMAAPKKIVPVAQPITQMSYKAVEDKKTAAPVVARTENLDGSARRLPGDENSIARLLFVLHHGSDFNERLWASCQLTRVDWRATPEVVTELLSAAKKDSEGIVRVTCIRCLEVMEVNTPHFVAALESMKNDKDPYVKRAVEEVLLKVRSTALRQ